MSGPVTVTFPSVGSSTTFLVPGGVATIDCIVRGALGGGSAGASGYPSGSGAVFRGFLAVTPGETLDIQVGTRGGLGGNLVSSANGTGTPGWPDGGTGGIMGSRHGAGGGGSSRIWRGGIGGTLLICAGGGGGVGVLDPNFASPGTWPQMGNASVNELFTADTGRNGNSDGGGRGGQAGAGGAAGTGGLTTAVGTAGASFQGGNGGSITFPSFAGGGGGGGWFGGGGGAGRNPLGSIANYAGGGQGGGGSNFLAASGWSSVTWTAPSSVTGDAIITFTYTLPVGRRGFALGMPLVKQLG